MGCEQTVERALGNIYVRPNTLLHAGDVTQGHTHNFDHVTVIFRGAVHVKATLPSGQIIEQDFAAGDYFLIRADVTHEFTALMDDTLYICAYSHRTPQGEVVQDYTGWDEAYR